MMETDEQLKAMLDGAAFAVVENVGWIRVSGEDRVRWLNGMVTNSITALKPGDGCYCFFLSAQGRIQGDCTAWMGEIDGKQDLLLQTALDKVPAIIEYLERFIIMDDVELHAVKPTSGLLFIGPQAGSILASLRLDVPARELSWIQDDDTWVDVVHLNSPLVPRYEVWQMSPADSFIRMLLERNVIQVSSESLEQLRLIEGRPVYGVDIREKELPQETDQTRALHFSKGCYLGQEIVERIHSRGQVNRLFTPLTLSGAVPAAGTVLMAGEKAVGEITSAAEVPGYGVLGLGYVRREALDRGAALEYEGGTAAVRVVRGGESLHP